MNGPDIEARLDPEMRAAMAESARALGGIEIDWKDLAAARHAYETERGFWNADRPDVAFVQNHLVPGPHGPIPVRLYRPAIGGLLPVLVYLHGGGYVLGSLDTHDRVMRLLALKSGAAVFGVDYRLAPEHRFPAQLEETAAVLDWISTQAASVELDRRRVALGGDLAGAHLALGAALARKPTATKLKALILYYGAFGLADFGLAPPLRRGGERPLARGPRLLRRELSRTDLRRWAIRAMIASPATSPGCRPPISSPASSIPLLDDSLALAALLGDARRAAPAPPL